MAGRHTDSQSEWNAAARLQVSASESGSFENAHGRSREEPNGDLSGAAFPLGGAKERSPRVRLSGGIRTRWRPGPTVCREEP